MATHLVWLVGNRFDNSVCVCVYVYHLTMRKPHMLTTDMIEIVQAYPLGLVASIRPDGRPAISQGHIFPNPARTDCLRTYPLAKQHNLSHNVYYVINT